MDQKAEAYQLWAQELDAQKRAKSLDQRIREHLDAQPYHAWSPFKHFVSCERCGIVRNPANTDKPCKGHIPVTMRQP